MKIKPPGPNGPSKIPEPPQGSAEKTESTNGTSGAASAFSDKVSGATKSDKSENIGKTSSIRTKDLAAEIRSGSISTKAALEEIMSRVVEGQLGPGASETLQKDMTDMLRKTLESDPVLAEKLKLLNIN